MIPLFKVFMSDTAGQAAADVLYSGYVGEGDKVAEFENVIADVIGNPHVLAMNSGTSAITMALRMAGVEHGDYVLSTPMTCLATNAPILALGAQPIWVDVDKNTGNMTEETLDEAISNNLSVMSCVKAVMCMHWGGTPCDMLGINNVAFDNDLPVIEDACQAFGGTYSSDMNGYYSDYVCFSFQAIKYITSVDGGAISFKSYDERERGRLMRWYGFDRKLGLSMRCLQDPEEYGYKFHMNNLNAAIGLENIQHLDTIMTVVREHARRYSDELSDIDSNKIKVPVYDENSSYWLYTLIVEDSAAFISHMRNNEIECSKAHGRNDIKKIFKYSKAYLPGVDYFSEHEVCIPVGWWLNDEDVSYIIDSVKDYCKEN